MTIFNSSSQKKEAAQPALAETPTPAARDTTLSSANTDFAPATFPRSNAAPAPAAAPSGKESLISADLTIEGKIEGSGNVRIAGKFKGDVNVQGDLSIEHGAKLNGSVRAKKVTVAGELEGNIESAARVELLESAVLVGDLKAGNLTVSAGSKIRGHIDCGWDDAAARGASKSESASDA